MKLNPPKKKIQNLVNPKKKYNDRVDQSRSLFGEITKNFSIPIQSLSEKLKEGSANKISLESLNSELTQLLNDFWSDAQEKSKKCKTLDCKTFENTLAISPNLQGLDDLLENINPLLKNIPANLIKGSWTLDPLAKATKITLSDDCLTAKKSEGSSHCAVCSNIPLSDGIYSWEIKVSGITKENRDYVQFGLVDKKEMGDVNSFASKANWSVHSGNYAGNLCKMTKTEETVDFNNKTFICTFDGQSGKFTVEGVDNKFKAEVSGLQNKKLYAFVNLYDPGNEVTMRVIY